MFSGGRTLQDAILQTKIGGTLLNFSPHREGIIVSEKRLEKMRELLKPSTFELFQWLGIGVTFIEEGDKLTYKIDPCPFLTPGQRSKLDEMVALSLGQCRVLTPEEAMEFLDELSPKIIIPK